MSEPRIEASLMELRAAAPVAPDLLRARVRAIATAERPRMTFRWRPALAISVVSIIAIFGSTAALNGLKSALETPASRELGGNSARSVYGGPMSRSPDKEATTLAPTLWTKRLQRQDVSMSLRVRDLSGATQTAVRTTRRLGGYVAAADYSTDPNAGNSHLALRVPVQNVQKAIARFTELGTILSQHISVVDLQGGVDRFDARIAALQKRMAKLDGIRLDEAQRTLRRLKRSRTALVRQGAYADMSLQLTTRKLAEKQVAPGRFDRFWGNAGDILEKELIAVLYVLVVAGPFAILAVLALLAERARRRRADHRLLEETG